MSGLDYEKAGVSIRKGDNFAEFIKGIPSKAVSKGIGGFAGGAALDLRGYREPGPPLDDRRRRDQAPRREEARSLRHDPA